MQASYVVDHKSGVGISNVYLSIVFRENVHSYFPPL